MEEVKSLEGLVMKVNGVLTLLVPLGNRGAELAETACGISEAQGDFLKIAIPEWLAGMLEIEEGDLVCVGNTDGEFEIHASSQDPVH